MIRRLQSQLFKFCVLVILILTTGLAIHINYAGSDFDPIEKIYQLQKENRRDDANDLVQSFKNSDSIDQDEIQKLENELEYTTLEKLKSITWNGAVKGEVYDKYSGIGAISADLVILGDLRDIAIQSWNYMTDRERYDSLIMILSAAGVGLSSTTFVNGCVSLAKNTSKYLMSVPSLAKKGLLKIFLTGSMTAGHSEKIWSLFKTNEWSIPRTVSTLASVHNARELDIAADIINRHKFTGNAFIHLNGSNGLNLYESLPNRLQHILLKGFYKNPIAVCGLTRLHLLIHSIKILKKYHLSVLAIPLTAFAMFLSMLPKPLVWFTFIASLLYLLAITAKPVYAFKRKEKIQYE